ncbi:MAG TPA: hypothetical protein VMM83_08380 [Longimicrobiales bacterium]|nr:hypothetical protein [Longimicrobiales bacterium]
MSDKRRPTYAPTLLAAAALAFAGVGGVARGAAAQVQPPPPPADSGTLVTVVPGAQYEAGSLQRFFLGDNYRFLWTREMTVPILDLNRFAGGLTIDHPGGNQTRTLHFFGADGREYMFRSIQKYVRPTLTPDLEGTIVEDIMQDVISALHPGGAFVVAPLQRSLGLLTEPIWIRVMPDDPRLGEYREGYAGLVGQMLEKSNEGEDDTPGTWGYTKIIGSEELLEKLEENPRNRVHTREMLAYKLLDFLVGDTDRGLEDQWRWAREPVDHGFLWRPVARDRDWAFVNAEGVLPAIIRRWYDKVADYSPELAPLTTYVWQDQGLSRRLLTDLEKPEWDAVVDRFVATLTDDVIDAAVSQLPPEHQPGHAEWLAETLRSRRDALPELADEYYAWLAADVDIRATDVSDRLEAVRDPDGSLLVTLYAAADELVPVVEDDDEEEDDTGARGGVATSSTSASAPGSGLRPYYTRRFLPNETDEVRVYLHGGDDVAVVRGEGARAITLRVIGGGGDDELVDVARSSGRTAFYDDRGDNRIVPGPRTSVDTRRYDPPEEGESWLETTTQDARVQDWGDAHSWVNPILDYREGAGLIVGAGPRWTDYGFRTHPYESRFGARLLFATLPATFGVEAMADFRRENSPVHFTMDARATRFEAIRFYGYGNQSPLAPAPDALVMMDQVRLAAALAVDGGWWDAAIGPLLLYTDPEIPTLPLPALRGGERFGQAGALARVSLDRASGTVRASGFGMDAQTTAFPGLWDAPEPFGRTAAEARAYFGIPIATEPTVALRAGAQHAWGAFPVHDAAAIGGRTSLRGYRWQRFAGDAALYGGAELRVPLFRVELITKGRLGVLGLADAGRVYVDGSSSGGWHTGFGAGLWFATMGQALSVTWARGEEDRFYLGLGMPF